MPRAGTDAPRTLLPAPSVADYAEPRLLSPVPHLMDDTSSLELLGHRLCVRLWGSPFHDGLRQRGDRLSKLTSSSLAFGISSLVVGAKLMQGWAWAASTRRAINSLQKTFLEFLNTYELYDFPVSGDTLVVFAAFLITSGRLTNSRSVRHGSISRLQVHYTGCSGLLATPPPPTVLRRTRCAALTARSASLSSTDFWWMVLFFLI